jgi:hypothetical protein
MYTATSIRCPFSLNTPSPVLCSLTWREQGPELSHSEAFRQTVPFVDLDHQHSELTTLRLVPHRLATRINWDEICGSRLLQHLAFYLHRFPLEYSLLVIQLLLSKVGEIRNRIQTIFEMK